MASRDDSKRTSSRKLSSSAMLGSAALALGATSEAASAIFGFFAGDGRLVSSRAMGVGVVSDLGELREDDEDDDEEEDDEDDEDDEDPKLDITSANSFRHFAMSILRLFADIFLSAA
jgi:hypothetical protein